MRRSGRIGFGLTALALVLAFTAGAPAQELSVAAGAGGFLPMGEAYRSLYGSGSSFGADLWFKLKGPVGFAVGFSRLADKGVAVSLDGGSEAYPLEFRRASVPILVFGQIDAGPVAFRLGAGAGIHAYRETWTTVDLEYKGHKVSPRFVLMISAALTGRLAVFCSAASESLRTGVNSPLAVNVNAGGLQVLGGLAFRIF